MKLHPLLLAAVFPFILFFPLSAGEIPQTVKDSNRIMLPDYTAVELSVPEALKRLSDLSIKADPQKKGVSVMLDPGIAPSTLKNINLTLKNVPVSEILRFVSLFTGLRPKYEEKAVILVSTKYNSDINTWEVLTLPGRENQEEHDHFFNQANHSNDEWVVSKNGGKVIAQLQKDLPLPQDESPGFDIIGEINGTPALPFKSLKTHNGWIVAYNRGEWGGAVFWFSSDGKQRKKLSNHQIKEFLVDGDRIFAIEGLAHLSLSRGSMIEFKKDRNEWAISEFLSLPASPETITKIAPGEYAIVTSKTLLQVNLEKKISVLVSQGDWGILYPNSIEFDDHFIYIGMRQFVARFKRGENPNLEFLVPDPSWLTIDTR